MTKEFKKFPDGFLWGAATSAHQVEGGLHNNWTEWEKGNAQRLAAGSQKAFDTDSVHWLAIKDAAQDPANYISGLACDHYRRYEEDFDIAKSLGHNVHRFSIEWSRIEPRRGEYDDDAINHYKKVITALKKRGIEPFVTLFHWTTPVWVAQQGDWYSDKTAGAFLRFVRHVVKSLGDEVTFWTTFNEPEVFCQLSYRKGYWPPEGQNTLKALGVIRRLIKTHRRAYDLIKSINQEAQVGATIHNVYIDRPRGMMGKAKSAVLGYMANEYFVSGIRGQQDFIGLNYYFRMFVKGLDLEMSSNDPTDMGWGMFPEGIYHILRRLADFNKPIYITECGVADRDDVYRSWYIHEILGWLHQAIGEGVDVRGFMYWSLLDNFEWDKGFWPRFGLVAVDYKTQKRTVRPSARQYAKLARANGFTVVE